MEGVNFYAIRIKGTELYKCSYDTFDSFHVAISSGVYYNQRKNAEKILAKLHEKLYNTSNRYPEPSRFIIVENKVIQYYSTSKEFVEKFSKLYDIKLKDIELEIVELIMTKA